MFILKSVFLLCEDIFFAPVKNNILFGYPKKIGGVLVNNPIWLAPLAGITFASVRSFYKDLGAGLVHTEMVSALGLCHKGRKTKELLYGDDTESPIALQLFASNADDLAKGAEVALSIRKFDAIQVNMACPVPKVTKRGCGSKLLENVSESASMMKVLKPFGLPVWAKIRIIPSTSSISTSYFCEELFDAGADYVFVHGRTAAQKYEGESSKEEVIKTALNFPGMIGASGDCYSPYDMAVYLDGGCSSVLAARGILKDIFLIPKTLKYLGCDVLADFTEPDYDAQSKILLELGRRIYNTEGESLALGMTRRMLSALFKEFSGAAALRRYGSGIRTWREMESLLLDWKNADAYIYTA